MKLESKESCLHKTKIIHKWFLDDLDKAYKKLKRAEETSDLSSAPSEVETETFRKRPKKKPSRYINDPEEEEEDEDNRPLSSRFQRPEKVNFLQAGITDLKGIFVFFW